MYNINFKQRDRDNPKINGILLVNGTLRDTDYESFKINLKKLKKIVQRERKQREIQKRSNFNYEF